ncbi:MAG: TIGR03936 family radical SAM-associated protein [Lachnospiraceae bacterium]|nr:TIGR03936 family radical SAM-associated protein [Lachnospiraceae bacterium]
MKIRIKFSKQGQMRFIGHLDIMRFFQKAIRRAGININYSEGFSPHQKMSFASPLGVGLISSGEYFDIESNTSFSSEESLRLLNGAMVEGMEVTSFKKLPDNAKNCMASIAAADYVLHINNTANPITKEITDSFLSRDNVVITKKTKKSEREINIRPFIYELSSDEKSVFMKVASGSVNNIKPEIVIDAICSLYNLDTPKGIYERVEMYANTGTEDNINLVTLESLGENIE